MDPLTFLTVLGGGSGIVALWKIANGLGRFESRTTTILEGVNIMLRDHEDRLRQLERK